MNPEQENFESLRRLLALKRHEVPPPGYFHDFAGQVIARIRAGEQANRGGFWESLSWEAPWLQRLWGAFETKPIFAGALGMIVCGFLVTGAVYSQKLPDVAMPGAPSVAGTDNTVQRGPAPEGLATIGFGEPASFASFDGIRLPATPAVSFPSIGQ
jgi:hypothetical protein